MAEQKEVVFVDGMIFKKPREGAPDFVKGHISIKAPELIAFLQKHAKSDGWVNIDMKKSKDGSKLYFQLNDWTPPVKMSETEAKAIFDGQAVPPPGYEPITPADIPF